jgi:hypothetical protein
VGGYQGNNPRGYGYANNSPIYIYWAIIDYLIQMKAIVKKGLKILVL